MRQVLQKTRHARRGVLSLELVLVLPILLTVLFAVIEFSCVFVSRGTLVDAARAGARIAARESDASVESQVQETVRQVLGRQLGRNAEIRMRTGDRSGDEVIVAIRVPMEQTAPNLLWPIGYNLQGRYLQSQVVMVKE